MIIDFRNRYSKITNKSMEYWKSLGARIILFTLHHPNDYSNLEKIADIVGTIKANDLETGIYTGLLGLEKKGTIKNNPEIENWQQRTKDSRAVTYISDSGRTFCPNSPYLEEFRIPLVQKAVKVLDLDVVYFDLPWFFSKACFCDYCKESFEEFLEKTGSVNKKDFPSGWRDPNLANFLRFKNRSIRNAVKRTTTRLRQIKSNFKVIYNFGACLSRYDELSHGSWITGLSELESSVLLEVNPYIANTPLQVVHASILLTRESLKDKGEVYFASTLRSNRKSKFYTPETIFELYSTIISAGGQPYLGCDIIEDPNLLSAPLEDYVEIFEKLKQIKPKKEKPKIAIIYDPLSQYFSEKPGTSRISKGPRLFQKEYLKPLWGCISQLKDSDQAYTITPLEDIDIERFDKIILPRTLVMSEIEYINCLKYQKN